MDSLEQMPGELRAALEDNIASISRSLILVVDDEPVMVRLLEDVLSQDGHTVISASSGDEALHLVKKMTPDLILMDIIMPEMDGYEATSRIKLRPDLQNTPVIFLTGRPADEDGGRSFAVGGTAFLCKPFKDHQIRDVVNLALRSAAETI